ncbi:MAG: 23S rRNA (pseudouridine(1915)-N(3))-methyltransferase RlmH [archaeon]|nr:23S rRNA (pseudouridine(1915)-N(3))-methyltransferase RlmH [archaeon]
MIKIIAVGKNNALLRHYESEIVRRIGRISRFELVELKGDKSKNPLEIIRKEDESILSRIKEEEFVCALDVSGVSVDSFGFSDVIREHDNIVFVIGGAYGFGDKVRLRADLSLSFSLLTFNHQVFRVMLLEQVYRSLSIIAGGKYHK